jgi:hypothetical protein
MALMALEVEPPVGPMNFTAMSCARRVVPATPRALSRTAPTVPARGCRARPARRRRRRPGCRDEVPAVDVVDEAVAVVVEPVDGLVGVAPHGLGQVGVGDVDTGVGDGDDGAGTGPGVGCGPRLGRPDVDAGGARDAGDRLAAVLQAPLHAEAGVVAGRLQPRVGLGDGHPGVLRQLRRQLLRRHAVRRRHDLGGRQRQPRLALDAQGLPHRGAGGGGRTGLPLHDDAGRRGPRRRGRRRCGGRRRVLGGESVAGGADEGCRGDEGDEAGGHARLTPSSRPCRTGHEPHNVAPGGPVPLAPHGTSR